MLLLRSLPGPTIKRFDTIVLLSEALKFFMFRIAIISLITLRVVLCPLFCGGCADSVYASEVTEGVQSTCCETNCDPCGSGERPAPSPCDCPEDSPGVPCDSGCVSHAAPELIERISSEDLGLSFCVGPVFFAVVDSLGNVSFPYAERSHRFDLESGHTIRLVFASLLL
jgi:hypothetical protein